MPSFDDSMETDYIVVGAGTAGCVLASRLTERATERVLLLEAGATDWHPLLTVPAAFPYLMDNPRVNWRHRSEPEPSTHNRQLHLPQGKVLGGSSSINGLLWVRGQREDFDDWQQAGCEGWTYEEVLPYFMRSESYSGGDSAYRGRSGPIKVEDYRCFHPLTVKFVRAAQESGVPFNADMNGATQSGVGYFQQTRSMRRRSSAARAYLRGTAGRSNLRTETNALVTRVLFEGRRAIGVTFERGGTTTSVRARKEVVLTAGVLHSPHLLQLSGVGAGERLHALGIAVVAELPGVGNNLRDHYAVRIAHRVQGALSINQQTRGLRLVGEIAKYVFAGRGVLTLGAGNAAAFCGPSPGARSDLQITFSPASYKQAVLGSLLGDEPGMTVAVWPQRALSTGSVFARTRDPREAPIIRPGHLSAEEDQRVMLRGIRTARRIFAAPALAHHSAGETLPGLTVQDDDELLDYSRRFGSSVYHMVGTCRMGSDSEAVVDSTLRVHGVAGLRVADASIMPASVSANTYAATIMIGERASAFIQASL